MLAKHTRNIYFILFHLSCADGISLTGQMSTMVSENLEGEDVQGDKGRTFISYDDGLMAGL